MASDFQIPSLSPEITAVLINKGYGACLLTLYSTKPTNVLKRVILEAARAQLHPDGIVDIVVYKERIHVMRPKIQAHFIEGKPTLVADDHPRPVQGSYLRMIYPISDNVNVAEKLREADAIRAAESCATLISMMHGEFVAMEQHYNAAVSLVRNETSAMTGGRYVRQTMENEPLEQKMACIFDEQGDSALVYSSIAMSLLNRAHHETDNTNKFLFLWLALETILGSGSARRDVLP